MRSLLKSGGSRDEYRRFSVSLEFREVRSLTAAINYVIDPQRDCDTLLQSVREFMPKI